MSIKRQATTELNHENWDQEDPADQNEMGTFKTASKDVLEKRVIRTARRRNPISMNDEPKKSVFMNTKLANASKPSSFDFLANLTNQAKNSNGSATETSSSPNLFGSKPMSLSGGLFGSSATNSTIGNSMTTTSLGAKHTGQSGNLFGISSVKEPDCDSKRNKSSDSKSPSQTGGLFSNSTSNVTNSIFSNQSPGSKPQSDRLFGNFDLKPSDSIFAKPFASASPVGPDTKSPKSSLFTSKKADTSMNESPPKDQTTSSTSNTLISTTLPPITPERKGEVPNEKKIKYYSKLKGLNESVCDWITKHVAQSPICILSPIFQDYDKYLKEITDEYQENANDTKKNTNSDPETKTSINNTTTSNNGVPTASTGGLQFGSVSAERKLSPFGSKTKHPTLDTSTSNNSFAFEVTSPAASESSTNNKTSTYSFGKTSNATSATTSSASFAFGAPIASSTSSPSNPSKSETGEQNNSFSFGMKTSKNSTNGSSFPFGMTSNIANSSSSPFSSTSFTSTKPLTVGSPSENKSSTFSFGTKTSSSNTNNPATSTGFAFGATSPVSSATSSPFALPPNNSTVQNGSAFSFGMGKPFSFSATNIQQNSEKSTNVETKEDEDEPPKVEYTPVKEDNRVYEKICKVFVKNDGNFADKGVGTLYLKKIEDSPKHQLLVRANTNLGTILLNFILSSSIPMQKAGKNNVMLVCIPTPNAKPPPTPVLIRVKTSEAADELLETLKKYAV